MMFSLVWARVRVHSNGFFQLTSKFTVLEIKTFSGCPYAKCRATKPLNLVALMTAWLPIQIDPT